MICPPKFSSPHAKLDLRGNPTPHSQNAGNHDPINLIPPLSIPSFDLAMNLVHPASDSAGFGPRFNRKRSGHLAVPGNGLDWMWSQIQLNKTTCFITKMGIWAKDQSRFQFKTQYFDSLPEAEWESLEDDLNDYFDIRYQGDLRKFIKWTCSWNDERPKLYRRNYACHATHENALHHPPKGMNPDTWRAICEDVFLGENWKERSTWNSSNRTHQVMLHKAGRTRFAQRVETLRDEFQRSPTRAAVFQKCYKGKNGYVNAVTEEATEHLVTMASQCPQNEDAIFREVLGPERKGRKRGMGWTTTPDADINLLRYKIEEMTTKLAERDAIDKERDIKDAEIQQKIVELENKFESLSRCLAMQVPPHAPQQFLMSQFLYEQHMQRPYCQPLMSSFMELL